MEHTYSRVTFEEAERIMNTEPAHVLFDVREEEEYSTGHAKDAVLFPLDTITAETAAERIPSFSTPVLVYCRSGRRSREAAEKLVALGYTRVFDIGSLVGWPYGLVWG